MERSRVLNQTQHERGWRRRYYNHFYIILYLVAIIAANLTVAWWGPRMVIINAFLFIGLDLTARDGLHEAWHGRGLVWKMLVLVGTGSVLSWALALVIGGSAGRVAVASFVAFALAGVADAVVYHFLHRHHRLLKINGSNVAGAAVDSLIFPTLAFGALMPWIILGQFVAKVGGGFVWSLILARK